MSDCEPAKPFPPRPIGVTRPDVQPARRPINRSGVPTQVSGTVTESQDLKDTACRSDSGGDSIERITTDVEQFTRDWIGRIRRLIHRSSQLVEREALLAGAIAKLNDQKSDWSKRTAERERSLKEQTERLTAAWLEVEAERRKAIQGARQSAAKQRVAQVQASQTTVAPLAATVSSERLAADVPQSGSGQSAMDAQPAFLPPENQAEETSAGHMPENVPVPIAPMPMMGHPLQNQPISNTDTGAASRQKIEEFKRMKQAIRSSRNR